MYEAIVARVKTRPHPNADRVQLGDVLGYQVVVGLDTQNGDLGVFFPVDGQLSHDFCLANLLYDKHPETGRAMGGYFGKNRRVRAQRFRGEISEGFWCPIHYLEYRDRIQWDPNEGDRFTHGPISQIEYCRKYETPATRNAQVAKKQKRAEIPNFPRHYDTPQLRENLHFRPDSLVVVTEKLHGTSARTGYVMAPAPRWYHRAWNWLAERTGLPTMTPPDELTYVSGTRRCILEPDADGEKGKGYRQHWHDTIAPRLLPGEVVYYEIVGYEETGALIMDSHSTEGLDKRDKKLLRKMYDRPVPDAVTYTYGCAPGESQAYVYRITVDGEELTWYEVELRSKQVGLPTVPVIEYLRGEDINLEQCNEMTRHRSALSDGPCEGIILREERKDERGDPVIEKALKHKSYLFCALEGIRKNDENYVDTEEAA